MNLEGKPVEFVPAREENGISRNVLSWLNTFQGLPLYIERLDYEFMDADTVCMALSLVQSPYIVERFIDGSYIADYQFKIIFRLNPSGSSARLDADEMLDQLGAWADGQIPYIGDGLEVQELEQTTPAALYARMEGGWEDHQIFMRMTYKVTPGK